MYPPLLCVCKDIREEIRDPQNRKKVVHARMFELCDQVHSIRSERAREHAKRRESDEISLCSNPSVTLYHCHAERLEPFTPTPFPNSRERGFILRAWNNDTYHPFDCHLVSFHSISSDRVSSTIKVSHRLVRDCLAIRIISCTKTLLFLWLRSHFPDWGVPFSIQLFNCFFLLTFVRECSLFPPLPSSHLHLWIELLRAEVFSLVN